MTSPELPNTIENIVGIDEAGRGALAGPVVVSAVMLTKNSPLNDLKDSKCLTESKRNMIYHTLISTTPYIRTAIINHHEIDKTNILAATLKGMLYCIDKLKPYSKEIIIDGNIGPKTDTYSYKTVIKGDQLIPAISAASIIAKVTRDKIMKKLDKHYKHYDFATNKGYGTKEHIERILSYGKSNVHRQTFNVTKQLNLF